MKVIKKEEFPSLLLGLSFFGCGGGGYISDGQKLLQDFDEIKLYDIDELPQDSFAVSCYSCGSLSEKKVLGKKESCAFKTMEKFLGKRISALFATELGAYNTPVLFKIAKSAGDTAVIDGDAAGRAVPNIEHSLIVKGGKLPTPLSICSEDGDRIVIEDVSEIRKLEEIVRPLSEKLGNLGVCDSVIKISEAKKYLKLESISKALEVGKLIQERNLKGILDAIGGEIIYKGKIKEVIVEKEGGFVEGRIIFDDGCYVKFINENMGFYEKGIEIHFPDLIVILNEKDLHPIENPPKEKVDIIVVAAKADKRWYR
ncbi:MAG: DUF917 domain-containing protein [Thermotogaceae bacterium]|nr:DUF917 domain-containing protein [Thermotogaceae bacterium]